MKNSLEREGKGGNIRFLIFFNFHGGFTITKKQWRFVYYS